MKKLGKFRRDLIREMAISPKQNVKMEKKKENEIQNYVGSSMQRMGIKEFNSVQKAIDRDRYRYPPQSRNLEIHLVQTGDSKEENQKQLALAMSDSKVSHEGGGQGLIKPININRNCACELD